MATYMIGLNPDCFGRTLILTAAATSRKPDQASVRFGDWTVTFSRQTA